MILRKSTDAETSTHSPLDFVLSTESKDRYNDTILAAGWDYKHFLNNPIALFGHDPNFPIGVWENLRVVGKQLQATLRLAPLGTSPRIDEIAKLIRARILRTVSVGFLPIKYKQRADGGVDYSKQQLVEASVVSVPANAEALAIEAKKLGISAKTIEKVFNRPPANASLAQRQEHARAVLTRTRATLARTTPPKSKATRLLLDECIADEYQHLTVDQIVAVELAKLEATKRVAAINREIKLTQRIREAQIEGQNPQDIVRAELARINRKQQKAQAVRDAEAMRRMSDILKKQGW